MLKPMLLTDGRQPFDDPAWLWEVKWDGIRCVAVKSAGAARLYSRHQREMTAQFPETVRALAGLPAGIYDGELVCLAGDGRADFYQVMERHGLQDGRRISRAAMTAPATFMAFDLIEHAGRRVTGLPLTDRKELLSALTWTGDGAQLVETFPGTAGSALFSAVGARDVEGIVGKRCSSIYRLDHRSTDWLKVKAWRTQEVTILGVRWEPEFGALVGAPGGAPLCVVELGWTPADRSALARLVPELAPRRHGDMTWVNPVLRARIRYRVTPTGKLREPVWDGFLLAA
ncbi:MAG TPA: hypothetical protein VNT01_01200 [Symbiobacteriaceae bacterium]|nr:hypothetical protein [Symbiobacteriaceae bacterium]